MKIIILGSGGAERIPKACCNCKVCNEARIKGFPYKRLGQSLYISDISILFDTPEDINESLNSNKIEMVKGIFYSHWHPDHVMGTRIVELLGKKTQPIMLNIPETSLEININGNSILGYYSSLGICNITDQTISTIGNISIERIPLTNGYASAFFITEGNTKVLYCPCHTKHLLIEERFISCDLFICCMGEIAAEEDCTDFEIDTMTKISELKPKQSIMTHIEESLGLSFDEFAEKEKSLKNLSFGYDGMEIIV